MSQWIIARILRRHPPTHTEVTHSSSQESCRRTDTTPELLAKAAGLVVASAGNQKQARIAHFVEYASACGALRSNHERGDGRKVRRTVNVAHAPGALKPQGSP